MNHVCVTDQNNKVQCVFPKLTLILHENEICINKRKFCQYRNEEGTSITKCHTAQKCIIRENKAICTYMDFSYYKCFFKKDCRCGSFTSWGNSDKYCSIEDGYKYVIDVASFHDWDPMMMRWSWKIHISLGKRQSIFGKVTTSTSNWKRKSQYDFFFGKK